MRGVPAIVQSGLFQAGEHMLPKPLTTFWTNSIKRPVYYQPANRLGEGLACRQVRFGQLVQGGQQRFSGRGECVGGRQCGADRRHARRVDDLPRHEKEFYERAQGGFVIRHQLLPQPGYGGDALAHADGGFWRDEPGRSGQQDQGVGQRRRFAKRVNGGDKPPHAPAEKREATFGLGGVFATLRPGHVGDLVHVSAEGVWARLVFRRSMAGEVYVYHPEAFG